MKKPLTDKEKVAALADAIMRADLELELILNPFDHHTAEWTLIICRRVRNILRRAMNRTGGTETPAKRRIDIQAMKANGILK